MIGKDSIIDFYYSHCLAFAVTLFALCRAFKFEGRVTASLVVFMIITYIYSKKEIDLYLFDSFFVLLPLLVFLHKSQFYPWLDCLYFILALVSYFAFRSKGCYDSVIKACCIFYFINLIVNVINICSPGTYLSICSILLNEQAVSDINYYFFNEGFLSGLADHYSRNAYFFVLGCCIFVSKLITTEKNRKNVFIMFLISIIMIMFIGKRGHLIFLITSIVYTNYIIKNNVVEKISWLIKFSLISATIMGFLVEFAPNVLFVLDRLVSQLSSGDVSTGRFELWSKAWNYFLEKPYFGWGYGFFSTTERNDYLDTYFSGVHNDYLQWLCEVGIVGLLINIIPAIIIYYYSHSIIKDMFYYNRSNYDESSRCIMTWSFLIQTFVLMYSITGLPHFDYEVNIIYYISMSIPVYYLNNYNSNSSFAKRRKLRW